MKKFLIFILILIIAVVISAAVFIVTFDANRYKYLVEEKITQAAGRPVEIGSLSLKFRGGIVFQADRFGLAGKQAADSQQISFQAERLFLKIDPWPLLRKEIQISECLLESPKIIIKNTAYSNSAPVQNAARSLPAAPASPQIPDQAIADFHISKIKISDGAFTYRDDSVDPPLNILIEKLDLELKGVSLKSPVQFKVSGELLLGERKYFSGEGRFSYPEAAVELSARLDQSIQISGSLDHVLEVPSGTFKIKIDNLDLSSFLTPEQKQGEYFTGILSADMTVSARGKQAEDLTASLNSAGFVTIASGALKNKNLLRENLQRITQIPGVGSLFEFNLGPKFDALLQSRDTQFSHFKANFKISNETATFQSIELTHEDYEVSLKGSAGLDQSIDLKGSLLIRSTLSEAMLKKVKELTLILDGNSQLVIPFIYRGRIPGAVPQPDLGNLAARTIQAVGTELLEQGLTALLKPKKSTEPEPAQNPS